MKHLHRYKRLAENKEAIVEYCEVCKKKLVTKKCRKAGRIDNEKYLQEHRLDFLQKGTREYNKHNKNK